MKSDWIKVSPLLSLWEDNTGTAAINLDHISYHRVESRDHIPSPSTKPGRINTSIWFWANCPAHRSEQDENICIGSVWAGKSKQNLRKTLRRLKTSLARSYLLYCESCLWVRWERRERHAKQCNNDFLLLSGFIALGKKWFMSLYSVFLYSVMSEYCYHREIKFL